MLIIFNWITIQSIILHLIFFNYGSVHIGKNSNKLASITSQFKVEDKMAPFRTAAMPFIAILDLEARRKAKEALKARRRIRCLKQQQWMRQFSNTLHRPFLGLFCPLWVSCCPWCLTHVAPVACSLHKAIKSLVSLNHHVSAFCSIMQGGCLK